MPDPAGNFYVGSYVTESSEVLESQAQNVDTEEGRQALSDFAVGGFNIGATITLTKQE